MSSFIGRELECRLFEEVLGGTLPYRILAVSGIGGIGKSTLLGKFRQRSGIADCPTGFVNARRMADPNASHEYHPVIEALELLGQSLRDSGCQAENLHKRLGRYRELHRQVTERFGGSEVLVTSLLRIGVLAVRVGSTILPIAKPLDVALPDDLPNQVAKVIANYRRASDRDLLWRPVERLTSSLITDLNACLLARPQRRVVLLFDEYELISPVIDVWLRDLFDGQYGPVHKRVLLVIASRERLGQDWIARGSTRGPEEIRQVPLQPFSVREAATYLERHLDAIEPERAVRMASHLGDPRRLPLVLRLLASDPQHLATQLDEGETFRLGVLANDLADRLFNGDHATPQQREAALAVSVARSFDLPLVKEVLGSCGISEPEQHFRWLERQDFVNPNAPPYTFYDLVREVFLARLQNSDPLRLERLHGRLYEHYERRVAARGGKETAHRLEIEAAYHELSCTRRDPLTTALNRLLHSLPAAYHLTTQWSAIFQQVAVERHDLSEMEKRQLERLAELLIASWNVSNPAGTGDRQRAFDPAMDVFFTSLYQIEPPLVSEADAEWWLRYFEGRRRMTAGRVDEVVRAKEELLDIWWRAEEVAGPGGVPDLLRFCVATDLGEACTTRGAIAEAIEWNRRALALAGKDRAPLRQALALYQLSTNQKRQGRYRLALYNLDQAVALLQEHAPSSNYHLGRFMLNKANSHTYLNEWPAAERAFEASRRYLKDVSPQSFAELSHRLGWLKRVSGRLDEALADHELAIRSFEQLESELLEHNAVATSVLPFLRGKALHSMGNVLCELGRHADALSAYGEAVEIFRHHGNERHEAIARKDSAWSRFLQCGLEDSEAELRQALVRLGERDRREECATHLTEGWLMLSRIRMVAGQLHSARKAVNRADALFTDFPDIDDPHLYARVSLQRALLDTLRREDAGVERLLQDVEAYATSEEPKRWALLASISLVRALRAQLANDASGACASLLEARAQAEAWNPYLPGEITELWNRLVSRSRG